jgi:serine/threonine protein kinase
VAKIKNKIKFCMGGEDKIHIFVYKFIEYGDISDYLIKTNDFYKIKSVILQMACIIIELAAKYHIFHGDLNSGNILIDKTNEEKINYVIDNEKIEITSYGVIPKIIDFGKSRFFNESMPLRNNDIWYDIINFIGVIMNYIKLKDMKNKLDKITNTVDMELPLLKDYIYYLIEHL